MKTKFFRLFSILIFLHLIISCGKKEEKYKTSSKQNVNSYKTENYINLKSSNYEKIITVELKKNEDCDYYVHGRIEYIKDQNVLAIIDYGNGECDDIATKEVDGKIYTFSLLDKNDSKASDYKKIIKNPLVQIEGCNYIVDGTIEYYKEQKLIATIDYGDGSCDNIATKSADGEIYTFQIKEKN